MVLAAAVIAAPPATYSGEAIFRGAFASPLPAPAFGLDFDVSTRTLWGISNVSAQGEIRHFDLSGHLIGGFTGQGDWNSVGIAVDPRDPVFDRSTKLDLRHIVGVEELRPQRTESEEQA